MLEKSPWKTRQEAVSSKKCHTSSWWLLILGLFLIPAISLGAVAEVEQSFTLQEGWNAIYLEVQPRQASPAAVFDDLPVLSVFTPSSRATASEYIQDPDEELLQDQGWRWWFPEMPRSALNNLFTLLPNRPYLVHLGDLGGASSVELTVSGQPRLESISWESDAFTLTGLPVDPAVLPTFGEFFSSSPGHQDFTAYRLVDGAWQAVAETEQVQSGEAYAIFTEGSSQAQGSLEVELGSLRELNFGSLLQNVRLRVKPLEGTSIRLELLESPEPVHLVWRRLDPASGGYVWEDLDGPIEFPVAAPGQEAWITLAVQRERFATEEVASVLSVTDGKGARRLIPVQAQVRIPAARRRGTALFPGLWRGEVAIQAVSESQQGGTTPTSTQKPFRLRLLIHVDADNQARLLKQVLFVREDGEFLPDGTQVPGREVLLTDDSLIGQFEGLAMRDGVLVGLRVSSAGFDFDGHDLPLSGSVNPGSIVTGLIQLTPEHPTNPFRHRFHPDHDNLDAEFVHPAPEALAIQRQITLEFDAASRGGSRPPEFGVSLLEGAWREVVSGLHKNDIHAEGRFQLRNISFTDTLNE